MSNIEIFALRIGMSERVLSFDKIFLYFRSICYPNPINLTCEKNYSSLCKSKLLHQQAEQNGTLTPSKVVKQPTKYEKILCFYLKTLPKPGE
jgi:hypothetical protein